MRAQKHLKTKQDKYRNNPHGGGEIKHWWMLNLYHAVLWWELTQRDGMNSHLLDSCFQTSTQEVSHMELITDETKEVFSCNKCNSTVMCLGDIILTDASESRIDKNWCLLNNQSIYNIFINGKYLSSIRDAPDGKYLQAHWNSGVTYIKKIGNLPGYSNPVWYNPNWISNIMSLGLVQKHHIVTYNSQDWN